MGAILRSDAGAEFSPCRKWRYLLWRRWDRTKPVANFLMLNPSTADEFKLVRVLADDSPANAVTAAFLKVVTPSGKVGYVPVETVLPIGGEQLCYVKEGGSWKIAGFLGGEPTK